MYKCLESTRSGPNEWPHRSLITPKTNRFELTVLWTETEYQQNGRKTLVIQPNPYRKSTGTVFVNSRLPLCVRENPESGLEHLTVKTEYDNRFPSVYLFESKCLLFYSRWRKYSSWVLENWLTMSLPTP